MAKTIEKISLADVIPNSIAHDKNVQALTAAIDPQLNEISKSIKETFIFSRLDSLPENVIDLLAWQWHVDFYEPALPIETKRELVRDSIKWHRKKGTKAAVEAALRKLGFIPTIKEWFEPEMQTAPYTFSVRGYYEKDHVNVDFLGEKTEEILLRVITGTMPARSRLVNLTVAPIPMDMSKHICYWDLCDWEHIEIKNYDWGFFEVTPSIVVDARSEFFRALSIDSDIQFLDTSTWGGVPYRWLLLERDFSRGIFAELNRNYTTTWNIPYGWGFFPWSDSERYSREFHEVTHRDYDLDFDIKDASLGSVYFIGFTARLQPYWDFRPWAKNITWGHNMGIPHVLPGQQSDFKADVQWTTADAPRAKWSKYRTWGNGNWRYAPTVGGACEGGTWKYEEEIA